MLNNRMKTNRLKMAGKAAGLLSLFAVVLVMNACNRGSNESARDPWEGADSIMALIEAPVFPDRDFMITDYGARKGIDFISEERRVGRECVSTFRFRCWTSN